MNLTRLLIVILAVFAGLFVVPGLLRMRGDHLDGFMRERIVQVKAAIGKSFEQFDPACTRSGETYIVDGIESAFGAFDERSPSNRRVQCRECDAYVRAGLLTDNDGQDGSSKRQYGSFTSGYSLTSLGRETYRETYIPQSNGKRAVNWKFCFGKTTLDHVDKGRRLPNAGGFFGQITYTARVENPHSFLFSPESRGLGLAKPASKENPLLPPVETAIQFVSATEAVLRSDIH